MFTDSQHIIYLLEKYSSGQATSGEIDQLFSLLRTENYDETVVSYIATQLESFEPGNAEDIAFWKTRLKGGARQITDATVVENDTNVVNMHEHVRPVHRVHFMRKWGWAAASIILMLGIGVYLFTTKTKKTPPTVAVVQAAGIAPGKNGAVLTLADGSRVVLDSLGNGVVATQHGTQVVLQGGGIAYDATNAATGEVAYNTMSTPKGRQFQVTLPDGTKVWLNAASSISYPTVFSGEKRQVSLTGEAYFEVMKNPKMPFVVNIHLSDEETLGPREAKIEVLGTHFNVNAYDNEATINTTLLEGSVKVVRSGYGNRQDNMQEVILKPRQQAVMRFISPITIDSSPDLNKVMSWKNGLFNFEGASLAEIMRQLERWYDIEVAYEKGIPDVEFEGKMTRDVPLNDLLKMLERSAIHFRIEGRKLIVLP